jgi:transcriptional regulator with XRE-family HTH domain
MLEVLMPIKDRLKELRKAAGLTQQDLAMKSGLSITTVVHIEAGRIPDPRISTLRALAKVLGVGLDELAGPEEEPDAEPPAPKRRKKGE